MNRKFKNGDHIFYDQGDGTYHVLKVVELTDGELIWRDLGIMRLDANTLTAT